MEIDIKSAILYSYLARLLGQHQDSTSHRINGFILLKNAKLLQTQLNDLKEGMHVDLPEGPLMSLVSEQDAQIEAELTLLLEGLITDHQVFRSFGYGNLFEQRYLSYDLWKTFQSANASLIIELLDNAFHAMSGDDDDVHINQRARNDILNDVAEVLNPHTTSMQPLNLSQAVRSGDIARVKDLLAHGCDPNAIVSENLNPSLRAFETLPLVEAIKHSHQEILDLLISHGANVDGPSDRISLSPLIAALQGENTYAISKLLSHMADFRILGKLQDADCLRLATNLIMNHGISTKSILRALRMSEVTEKRLRCALFGAGVEIKLSTIKNRLGYNVGFSHWSELICWTNTLDPVFDEERDMVRAIYRRDMESVDDHIKLGASPSLGLSTAMLIGDPRIFKLLLERGADTDCIVPSNARASLIAAIEAEDQKFVDMLLEACRASDSLGNLNFVHNELTPLMIAVRHNNECIVRSLILNGARPDFATQNGDSFTIARQNGFYEVLQILREGTRKEKIVLTEQWLRNNQADMKEQQNRPVGRLNKVRLRRLRLTFRKQHFVILACAEASVKALEAVGSAPRESSETNAWSLWKDLSDVLYPPRWPLGPISSTMVIHSLLTGPNINTRAWGLGFDADHEKAWKTGMNVMRALLAGKLPSSLNDTIMFLAIAKAMCLSAPTLGPSMSQSDFASDIGRWQMLFKEGNQIAFQEAVFSIWGIPLEQLNHVNSPDSETLAFFQELAVSLADDAELYFGLREHDYGLTASQERWQSRDKLWISEEDQHDLVREAPWMSIN